MGQSLRDYNNESDDSALQKFTINSIISALDFKTLNSDDINDIILKIKENDIDKADQTPSSDEEGEDDDNVQEFSDLDESKKSSTFVENKQTKKTLFMEIDDIIDDITGNNTEPQISPQPTTIPTVDPTNPDVKPNPALAPFRPKPGTNPKPKA